MNKRRIRERLIKVHKEWVDSIEDKTVQDLARRGTVITGGAITSMLLGEEPNDYDIYFLDKETTIAVSEYYVEIARKETGRGLKVLDGHRYLDGMKGIENYDDIDLEKLWWFKEEAYNMTKDRVRIFIQSDGFFKMPPPKDPKKVKPYRPKFFSANAVTLTDKIQIINRFYGEPEDVHKTFDFLHTFNYWRSDTKELSLNVDSLECILDKRLVYRGSKYPVCSIVRMRKFINRGWKINAGQILKVCFQLSELDLSNIEVLEDQLIGVDTAYFSNIICRIQLEQKTNKDFQIDETYVAKLVDEIFG